MQCFRTIMKAMSTNNIDSFEILVRKRVVGFTERLKVSENSIISVKAV